MGLFKRKPKVPESLAGAGFGIHGNSVHFGRFPITSMKPEPIPWIVVETDGESSTLLSAYGLYYTQFSSDPWCDREFGKSPVRRWLNDTFLEAAFNEEEREKLLYTSVPEEKQEDEDDEPWIHGSAYGKVWLPGKSDIEKWFAEGSRIAYNTPFAEAQAKALGEDISTSHECLYWTRTFNHRAVNPLVYFYMFGDARHGNPTDNHAIRPVIRVDLT